MHLPVPAHRLVAVGALGIAATTAAEVVTAPYSDAVSLLPLNPAVHVLKVAAVAGFVVGMLAVGARHRSSLGRIGSGATVAVALGTLLGAGPYSVLEVAVGTRGGAEATAARLDAAYDGPFAWISHVAAVGFLLLVVGLVTLAVVVARRRLLPSWRWLASVGAIPVAFAAGALGSAGLPVPHPPTWLFLGLWLAYGVPLRRRSRQDEPAAPVAAPLHR